jgi:hypothetical protein
MKVMKNVNIDVTSSLLHGVLVSTKKHHEAEKPVRRWGGLSQVVFMTFTPFMVHY